MPNLIALLPNSERIRLPKGSFARSEDVYVSLSQSEAQGLDYAFCPSSDGECTSFQKIPEDQTGTIVILQAAAERIKP